MTASRALWLSPSRRASIFFCFESSALMESTLRAVGTVVGVEVEVEAEGATVLRAEAGEVAKSWFQVSVSAMTPPLPEPGDSSRTLSA